MPRRLNSDQVRQRFNQYGFTILDPNFQYRNNKQQIRVRDDKECVMISTTRRGTLH